MFVEMNVGGTMMNALPAWSRVGTPSLLTLDVIERTDSHVAVRLSGELDLSMASFVSESLDALLAGGPASVVIDVDSLTFLDAAGIAAFVKAEAVAEARGGRVVLHGARGIVRRILDVTGHHHLCAD